MQAEWLGNRREFLAFTARSLAAGVVLISSLGCEAPRVPSVLRIRQFEERVEDKALSFEQAKEYIPLLAEYFATTIGSYKSVQEFVDNVYLVRRGYKDKDEESGEFTSVILNKQKPVHQASVVRYLLEDYPDLVLTELQARELVLNMKSASFYGVPEAWFTEGKIFLPLERLNNVPAKKEIPMESEKGSAPSIEVPLWQYQGFGHQVSCLPRVPVVKFRSALLHEIIHSDNPDLEFAAQENLVVSYNKAYARRQSLIKPFEWGKKQQFGVEFYYSGLLSGQPQETFLNEFVTDYFVARISSRDGLPYDLAYAEPYDFANFSAVLDQAEISDNELYRLYQQSKLEEFLMRVAGGARNISFTDEDQMLDFGTERFIMNRLSTGGFKSRPILWTDFVPYFDGIDLRIYQFVDPTRLNLQDFYLHPESVPFHMANATLSCLS